MTKASIFKREHFEKSWLRLLIQGAFLLILGLLVAASSLLNADAVVLAAREFSWLPLSGIIFVLLGLEELLEAYLAKEPREFHQNLQVGILDTVVGGLIIASVSEMPEQLKLLIAAFLIVRGSVRVVLVHALKLPQKLFTTLAGSVSMILGILIASDYTIGGAAFYSFSLNLEIAFRGWAMMTFAWWLRSRKMAEKQQSSKE